MRYEVMQWLMTTGIAPAAGAVSVVWVGWVIYAMRVETGKVDWDKALAWLFRAAVWMSYASGDPDLLAEVSRLPRKFFDKAWLDPSLLTETLSTVPLTDLGTTPLGTLRAMHFGDIPRNPNFIVLKWGLAAGSLAIQHRLAHPARRFLSNLRVLDTGPNGAWRDFGWLLSGVGALGSGAGYATGFPLVYGFGALTAAGFALHAVGLYREGNYLDMAIRGLAGGASIAWMFVWLIHDKGYIAAALIFVAGATGALSYSVEEGRLRRAAGLTGCTLVMAGAAGALAGLPIQMAGLLICVGALCNHAASLRKHLLGLKRRKD